VKQKVLQLVVDRIVVEGLGWSFRRRANGPVHCKRNSKKKTPR